MKETLKFLLIQVVRAQVCYIICRYNLQVSYIIYSCCTISHLVIIETLTELFSLRLAHPILFADGDLWETQFFGCSHLKLGVGSIGKVVDNAILDLVNSQTKPKD